MLLTQYEVQSKEQSPLSPLLFNSVLEALPNARRNGNKNTHWKGRNKLSLLAHGMIIYKENSTELKKQQNSWDK